MGSVTEEVSEQRSDEVQRELVRDVHRAWIISAMAKTVCEHGPEVSVRQVVGRAGVSRRRFYELFDNCDDCFRATFDEAVARATERASAGYFSERDWTDRLRTGLLGILAFFDSEPELARLAVLYATPATAASSRRSEVLARLAGLIDKAGRTAPGSGYPPSLTAEAVVGGAVGVIQARLLQSDPGPLTVLVSPLMSLIVLPYLGREAALRELARPVEERYSVPTQARRSEHAEDPLAGLDMRFTYRTLRVLAEIDATPGISNRAVAEAAGVRDPGQISKLLARVEGLGLVRNTGDGHSKGAANAWVLTARGVEVVRSVGPRLSRRSW